MLRSLLIASLLLGGVLQTACGDARDGQAAAGRESLSSTDERESEAAMGAPTGTGTGAAGTGRTADAPHAECVEGLRNETPEPLRELLDDIGYDRAFVDACAAQSAVERGEPSACDALTTSSARSGCRLRVAVRHQKPDACPESAGVGRDPVCLAWAARAPARCRAAPGLDSLRCRAPFESDASLCRELGPLRARCEDDTAALAQLLARDRDPRALPPSRSRLRLTFRSGARASRGRGREEEPLPFVLELDHGVRLVRDEAGRAVIVLVAERRALPDAGRYRIAPLAIPLPEVRTVARGPWDLPVGAALRMGVTPPAGSSHLHSVVDLPAAGEVSVEELRPRRGGRVSLVLDVSVDAGDGVYRLSGTLETYLRDVDPGPPASAD